LIEDKNNKFTGQDRGLSLDRGIFSGRPFAENCFG